MAYTVWSKYKNSNDWTIERSFGAETYAKELSDYLKKSGRLTRITKK